jgi:hypothetical protein
VPLVEDLASLLVLLEDLTLTRTPLTVLPTLCLLILMPSAALLLEQVVLATTLTTGAGLMPMVSTTTMFSKVLELVLSARVVEALAF